MATKKKSKGILEKLGDAVSSGAEAVVDAGSKAIHAVGDLLPTGTATPKRARAKSTTKAPKKAAAKAPKKAAAKAEAPKPKANAEVVAPSAAVTNAKAASSKAAKPAAAKKPVAKTKLKTPVAKVAATSVKTAASAGKKVPAKKK